jgi:hypothetical protein
MRINGNRVVVFGGKDNYPIYIYTNTYIHILHTHIYIIYCIYMHIYKIYNIYVCVYAYIQYVYICVCIHIYIHARVCVKLGYVPDCLNLISV